MQKYGHLLQYFLARLPPLSMVRSCRIWSLASLPWNFDTRCRGFKIELDDSNFQNLHILSQRLLVSICGNFRKKAWLSPTPTIPQKRCQKDLSAKGPRVQEGVKQRGGHRVARNLLCSLLAAAKATVSLNVGKGGPKYAFGLKLHLQSRPHCTISLARTHCTTSCSCQLH